MPTRRCGWSYGAVCLATVTSLLVPSRASASAVVISESGPDPAIVPALGIGFDVSLLTVHPPFVEEIGFHGEWTTLDSSFADLAPPGSYALDFNFCEVAGIPCPPSTGSAATNEAQDFTPTPGTLGPLPDMLVMTPIDADGTTTYPWLSDFSITLIDDSTGGGPDPFVPLGEIFNLSDTLQLTFTRELLAPSVIDVDGNFHSDSDVPEAVVLVLLGIGLIGALRVRKRNKWAA